MYSPIVRLILLVLALFMAWKSYLGGNMTSTYMSVVAIGLIIWGYFKNGTVYGSFQLLKKEKYDEAEKLLSKTKYPELLKKSQKSYYHFIKGFIELNRKNYEISSEQFATAIEMGLRTENDKAVANLALSEIELKKSNFERAQLILDNLKSTELKPEVRTELGRIQNEIDSLQH